MKSIACTMILAVLLTGCATSPFDTAGRQPAKLGPGQALAEPGSTGASVIWGGRIVGIVNTGNFSELEVLALPLGPGDRPRREADGGVRFVIRHPGFLEPVTYAPGRFVTALGRFSGIESRSVGAFPLDHAVLEAEQIELWPVDTNRGPRLNLGVGVRF